MNETKGINSTSPVLREEDRELLDALTKAEIVVVGAVGAVVILAVTAVILRLIMPRIRGRYSKDNAVKKKAIVEEKTGRLLAPGTPSSQSSRSSSSSRLSNQGDESDGTSYKTKSTYYSQNSLYPGKTSSFGNLRQQAALNSANASPASYRSKTTQRLNDDLISMISQQSMASLQSRQSQQSLISHESSGFEPLKLGEQYRENWEKAYEEQHPTHVHTNLSYISHPSDSVTIPDRYDTFPFRHNSQKSRSQETSQIPIIICPEHTRL